MHAVVRWVQEVLVPFLGPAGLFVVAFFDSSFLSLPEINDILVVTAAASNPASAWVPILMATLGSLAGCSVLRSIGKRGGEGLLVRRFGAARVEQTREAFRRWDVLALAIPAVLPPPMPFKIFVLSAGVFGFPYRRFALTLVVARGLRYLTWGWLGALYGTEALQMLKAVDGWFKAQWPFVVAALLSVVAIVAAVRHLRRGGRGPADVPPPI